MKKAKIMTAAESASMTVEEFVGQGVERTILRAALESGHHYVEPVVKFQITVAQGALVLTAQNGCMASMTPETAAQLEASNDSGATWVPLIGGAVSPGWAGVWLSPGAMLRVKR